MVDEEDRYYEGVKLYKLEPTMDFVFKRIFGQDDSKYSLLSLLNSILDGAPFIQDLKILNAETQKEDPFGKASRLDIEAITNDNIIVNVEIQCRDTGELFGRAVTYTSNLLVHNSNPNSINKEINAEDKGIQDALLLWTKMTSDDQIKA